LCTPAKDVCVHLPPSAVCVRNTYSCVRPRDTVVLQPLVQVTGDGDL
jgi:hypothetical protein